MIRDGCDGQSFHPLLGKKSSLFLIVLKKTFQNFFFEKLMTSAKISNFRFPSKNADVINFFKKLFLEMKDIHKLYLRAKFELIWIFQELLAF